MQNELLVKHLTHLQKKHQSILLSIMSITWGDLVEERWLISIFDIIIQNVFIHNTSESIEVTILLRRLVSLTNSSLLMLRRNIKLSILIELKKKLNIRVSLEDIKLNLSSLASLISLYKLLHFLSKRLIKKSTKIGVPIKSYMKKYRNIPITHFHSMVTLSTIQHIHLTQQKNLKSLMELV